MKTNRSSFATVSIPLLLLPRRSKIAWLSLGLCGLALTTSALAQSITMSAMSTFSPNGDGWLSVTEDSFLTDGSTNETQRGLAFNPTNNHLYITTRTGTTATVGAKIFDASTGVGLGNLNVTGIQFGSAGVLNGIGVTSDGFIYAANASQVANGSNPYKLYRWSSESSAPSQVNFAAGGLDAFRLGDNFDLIGSDTDGTTQIVAGYNGGTGYTIVSPSLLSSTLVSTGAANAFRGGVAFVDGSTVWGTLGPGTAISRSKTDGSLLGTSSLQDSVERQIDIVNVNGTWLMASVEAAHNTTNACDVRVYDITNSVNNGTGAITLLSTMNLVPAPYKDNINTGGAITFGAVTGNDVTLYAMSTNNGVQAFNIHVTPVPEPATAALLAGGLSLLAVRRRRAR